jgi:hypothetical protein
MILSVDVEKRNRHGKRERESGRAGDLGIGRWRKAESEE